MKIEILHPSEIPISFEQLDKHILSEIKLITEAEAKVNRGNVAEGILGCVLMAKTLVAQGDVTKVDVLKVINALRAAADNSDNPKYVEKKLQLSLYKGSNKIVALRIKLGAVDFNALVNNTYLSTAYEIDSSISYANLAANLNEFLDKFKKQKKADTCRINCVGLDDQKGTKIDISVKSDNLGEKTISLSVKTLSKQMGQVGAAWRSRKQGAQDVRGLADVLESIFGIRLDDAKYAEKYFTEVTDPTTRKPKSDAIIKVIREVYDDAIEQINAKYSPEVEEDDEEYVNFLRTMADGIAKEATGGDSNVQLLALKRNSFKLLDFTKLKTFMEDRNNNCRIVASGEARGSTKPYIVISLYVSSQEGGEVKHGNLISIRPKIRETETPRHYIQKEAGLTDLLDLFHK